MNIFKWAFGVGDEVEYDGGKKSGKVQRHRPEGMVDIKDGKSGKTDTRFGGAVKKKGK